MNAGGQFQNHEPELPPAANQRFLFMRNALRSTSKAYTNKVYCMVNPCERMSYRSQLDLLTLCRPAKHQRRGMADRP